MHHPVPSPTQPTPLSNHACLELSAILLLAALPLAHRAHAHPAEPENTLPAVQVVGTQDADGYRARKSATATKTDTPLAEIPQAITVVTSAQIVDQGAHNLQDALNYAAGVRSDAYGLDSRTDSVRVRGSSPSTFIDGMRQTNGFYTSSARPDPYTLERIEVLRGPSGMMYGQGSTAGVLNLVSKRPLDTFQGDIGVQLGNFGRRQVQADMTGPLTTDGRWRYRLIGLTRDADTQVDHVKDDRILLAPSLMWVPGDATSLILQASHQRDRSGSTSQFFPWSGTITPNVNGPIPSRRFIGEPSDRYDTDRTSIGWLFEHRFNLHWTLRQNTRYSWNHVDYFSHYADAFSTDPSTGLPGGWAIDPVNQRRIDRIAYGNVARARIATFDQHVEGHLQTGSIRHTLLAGLDYTRYRLDSATARGRNSIDVFDPVYGHPFLLLPTALPRNTQRQGGLYLQDQMKLGADWIVVTGLRHDRVNNATAGRAGEKSNATTGRFGLMYLLDSGWSPYVSYSESFTPQDGVDFYGRRYKPVTGEQFEGGIKYMPTDGNRQFTAALWQIKEKNRLTEDPGNPLNSIQTGQTRNRGLELEWKTRLGTHFDLLAHYNYTDLDMQLAAIPRHQAAVWGYGEIMPGISAGLGVRYMNSYRDSAMAPQIPSLHLIDMLLAWEHDRWRYALNVNNLADKLYYSACLSRGDCWIGARRTVVMSATRRF